MDILQIVIVALCIGGALLFFIVRGIRASKKAPRCSGGKDCGSSCSGCNK